MSCGLATHKRRTVLSNVNFVLPLAMWQHAHCRVVAAGHYLRWKAGASYRTSSQVWCSWNLPRLLLWDGSLTLMNIASLMDMAMLCTSLLSIGQLSTLMQCLKVLPCSYMGQWALRCSLNFLPKNFPDSQVNSFLWSSTAHLMGKFFEQVNAAVIGSPIIPLVATLFTLVHNCYLFLYMKCV